MKHSSQHISRIFAAPIIAILMAFAASSFAGVDTETDANDTILAGHDTVAYHTLNKAVVGSPAFTAEYNGAIYRFISAENRDLFRSNPGKYAPAYGGFCAYGMTFGKKFEIDGKAFEVVNGQLYVNKNLDVYKTWKKDVPGNLAKSEAQWPKVKGTPAADL